MNFFWTVLGIVSFILGFMGMFLPILPTTPLWLLASYCLLRGSKWLYNRVMSYDTFNEVVTNFNIYRAIPLRIKIISISTLWGTIIISCILVGKLWITILLLIVALAVTIHIQSYKTLSKEEQINLKKRAGAQDVTNKKC